MSSPTILIVAPEETFALRLTDVLHQTLQGYPVQVVRGSVDALIALTEIPVCCVVAAYDVPDIDGITLSQHITTHWPHIAVVLLTYGDRPDLYDAAEIAGCSAVIALPCPALRICTVIRALLEHAPTLYRVPRLLQTARTKEVVITAQGEIAILNVRPVGE